MGGAFTRSRIEAVPAELFQSKNRIMVRREASVHHFVVEKISKIACRKSCCNLIGSCYSAFCWLIKVGLLINRGRVYWEREIREISAIC